MKFMPVQSGWSRKRHVPLPAIQIPWDMISDHNVQASINHDGQTLDRLRDRGGLSSCEALAILDDRKWTPMENDEAYAELFRRIKQATDEAWK